MSVNISDKFSRNYQVIKAQVHKDGYTGRDVLEETNRRVEKHKKQMDNHDLRPVSVEEGIDLFTDYYNSLKGDNRQQKRDLDFARKKRNVLKPGDPQSYLFRPSAGRIRSGPEKYDLEGVDDATDNILGQGMPSFEKMVSARSKRHQ